MSLSGGAMLSEHQPRDAGAARTVGEAKAMALPVEVERKEAKEERKKAEMKLRTLLLAVKVGGVKGDFFQRYLGSQTPAGPNDTAAPTRTLHHEWLDAKRACSCWYFLAGRCGW